MAIILSSYTARHVLDGLLYQVLRAFRLVHLFVGLMQLRAQSQIDA